MVWRFVSTWLHYFLGGMPKKRKVEVGALDKLFMKAFGDYSARYYDGALGGWKNTLWAVKNENISYKNRIAAGEAMGYSQAADIYKNLEKGESVKIVSHSMGTAYSRGFVSGMNRWANENKVSFNFEYQVDLAGFDGSKLPAHPSVKKSFYKSGQDDWLANSKTWLEPSGINGVGKDSDISGAENISNPAEKDHSISSFTAKDVPASNNNSSKHAQSPPAHEESR